jgi:hypothetical protein
MDDINLLLELKEIQMKIKELKEKEKEVKAELGIK